MNTRSSIPVWFSILIITLFFTTCFSKCHVEITSRLPGNTPPVRLHCKSKNDDLGYRNLNVNQMFTFSFNMNFWHTTLFICDFWWTGKHLVSHVFDRHIWRDLPEDIFKFEVRTDGFFFWRMDNYGQYYFWDKLKDWGN
ncbi:hypothetical protein DCAR_0935751 [Daucus carota subsp. sativus]|uniref:S-protein homolog n=1 Tax=Daucus carota subsp. sativus TaxID=79200 RepID=A0AAF0Y043_DAUCS|nr:hypothetical protein DCAR_0935751 [Daucus carota subsp. sativus]